MDSIFNIFGTQGLAPHGYCLWRGAAIRRLGADRQRGWPGHDPDHDAGPDAVVGADVPVLRKPFALRDLAGLLRRQLG